MPSAVQRFKRSMPSAVQMFKSSMPSAVQMFKSSMPSAVQMFNAFGSSKVQKFNAFGCSRVQSRTCGTKVQRFNGLRPFKGSMVPSRKGSLHRLFSGGDSASLRTDCLFANCQLLPIAIGIANLFNSIFQRFNVSRL